jgi:ribonuclease HII
MLKNYARENNLKLVAGVDEVGWGAFAGPIVTAAVILPPDFESELIVDSKLICKSKTKMQKAYDLIMENAIAVSCTAVQASKINELGPQPSLDLCIKQSIDGLNEEPEWLLIDGNRYNPHRSDLPYKLVEKGDNTYLSIAAAAIIAKYRRDEYMVKVHDKHPHYNFSGSKGYYCSKHKVGLVEHGKSRYHRDKYVNTWSRNKGIILPK